MAVMCFMVCTLLPGYINPIGKNIVSWAVATAPKSARYKMNVNELNPQDLGTVLKIFGALFYYSPNQYHEVNMDKLFNETDENTTCLSNIISLFKNENADALQLEHDYLFSGVGDMKAPPWGSVYLDKESVVFGESLVEYRQFLQQCHLSFDKNSNEPEDHIGLMLMTLGLLFEDEKYIQAIDLLENHLMTWFGFYIKRLMSATQSPAYTELAKSTQEILSTLADKHQISVSNRRDYFYDNSHNTH